MPVLKHEIVAHISERGLSFDATAGVIVGSVLAFCVIVCLGLFITGRMRVVDDVDH
jgi:hypothetical protein